MFFEANFPEKKTLSWIIDYFELKQSDKNITLKEKIKLERLSLNQLLILERKGFYWSLSLALLKNHEISSNKNLL